MDVPYASPTCPDLASISDAELFKYFLNDDIGQSYTQAVPSSSPPFYESPPMTPDPIFSEIDAPFVIKEEYCLLHSPSGTNGSPSKGITGPMKAKSIRGYESRRKAYSFQQSSEEERQIKRQRRLVKNRESAQLSRMRKKIYIDDLEGKVSTLMTENSSLKAEVLNLQNVIKQLSAETCNAPRTLVGSVANAPPRVSSYNPVTPHPRHMVPARNTQAAGVCLLIVFFSLGLLFNVTSVSSHAAITAHSSTPDHHPRREATQFSSRSFVDSADRDMLDEFVSDNVINIAESAADPSHKRSIIHELPDEDTLQSVTHKRIKTEPAAPLFSSSSTTDNSIDISDSDDTLPDLYHNPDVSPVAIAVVVPSRTLSQQSLDLGLLPASTYRSLNIHIWPSIML
jgi:hypothetical protein